MPEQPKRQRKSAAEFKPFDGKGTGWGQEVASLREKGSSVSSQSATLLGLHRGPASWLPSSRAVSQLTLVGSPSCIIATRCLLLGAVIERRTTEGGAEYIRVVLGTQGGAATDVEDPSAVIDAEFLFLSGQGRSCLCAWLALCQEQHGRAGQGTAWQGTARQHHAATSAWRLRV